MRVVIVGLGSMGKRRVRNLKHLGIERIVGFDPRADRRDDAKTTYGVETAATIEEAFATAPDAVVISTPPDLHILYALAAARRGIPFFTEAGVLDDGFDELERAVSTSGAVAAPSCTLRYFAGPKFLLEAIQKEAIGKPLAFVYQTGQWLPDWHPWEDYRSFYVSRRATGACREIVPFELVWLTHLFGDVVAVQASKAKLSDLDADIDDIYQGLYEFSGGVRGMLQVDVLARAAVRHFRLMGSEGTLEWDAIANEVRQYSAASRSWTTTSLATGTVEASYAQWSAEEPYVDEMRDFLAAVRGDKPWGHSLAADRRILRTLYAAEESAAGGKRIGLAAADMCT